MAWIGLRLMLEESEVLSENVRSAGGLGMTAFAGSSASSSTSLEQPGVNDAGLGNLLLRFLAPIYHMDTTILDPTMLGDPFSREREFVKMRHRVKVLSQLSPITRFQKRFYRACCWSWESIMAT